MSSARHPSPITDDGSLVLEEPSVRSPRRSIASLRQQVVLRIPRDTHYLSLIRKVVADLGELAGFKRPDLDKIELAVDEACSNAIIYQVTSEGRGKFEDLEMEITVDRRAGKPGDDLRKSSAVNRARTERPGLQIVLRDRGDPYPFEEKGNIDLEDHLRAMEPGGLGIYIIKSFMDEVAYDHSPDDGNSLTMVKYLPSS